MSKFKPLLAASIEDTATIPYPVFSSAKLDGIRCLIVDGVAVSRSLKPIRNKHVQSLFGSADLNGFDGELIVGEPNASDVYRTTNSGVMSEDGEPDVSFYVFDRWDMPDTPYSERMSSLFSTISKWSNPRIKLVQQYRVQNETELLAIEEGALNEGYEGLMVRSGEGKYKYGRSTLKEFILGKLKRFSDSEFRVVGFTELFHNGNEATTNALGHTERSSHQENKVGRNVLGALVLETEDGQRFQCGTGFTDTLRAEIWAQRDAYLGKFAKVKHFEIGVKSLPRFPVFLGMRDAVDM